MNGQNKYPPYLIQKSSRAACPIIVSSPHSGTFYPENLFHLTDLKLADLQKYEDPAVADLMSFVPAMGLPLISAVFGRVWVDLNRHPLELDAMMFADTLPAQALTDSPRVLSGHGVIAAKINPTTPIYPKRLLWRKEQARITDVHIPYHTALSRQIQANIDRFGKSILLDMHSMPDLPIDKCAKGQMPDFVLGDCDGRSCHSELTMAAYEILTDLGFFVTINLPYSGAYTTYKYGVPAKHSHTLQIEIARSLYWNATDHQPSQNFKNLWFKLSVFMERLIQTLERKKI